MVKRRGWMPITTGVLFGLAWGLLAALLEGLSLVLEGPLWPHLGSRLLALAYLALIYGLLGAIAGGVMGGLALLGFWLSRRRVSHTALVAVYGGVLAAATLVIIWAHRFQPALLGWGVILTLAAAAGAAAGWLLDRAASGRDSSWPLFRRVVLAVFGVAVIAVLATAGFRALLGDLPLFSPSASGEVATAERPNILLITASGVRPDHLGINGYDKISPNVDALAWRGRRFEQAIAPASWTEPSLAAMLTSLYPSELGIACRAAISCQPHLDQERVTLAEALRDVGYRTQAYLTSPWLSAELGFDQGFDGFESVRAEEPFDLDPLRAGTLGWLLGCPRGAAPCDLMTKGHELLFVPPIPEGWGGGQVNDRVASFLDRHGEERFFLWLHYTEALPPYDLAPPIRPLPEGEMASTERRLSRMGYWQLGDPFTPRERLLPLDVEGLTALYDGEIHRMDQRLGELNFMLDASGLLDRTLVVFTSDQGQEFMEHGGYTYGHSLYDEVLQVPLIFAGPGVTFPPWVVEASVGLLDLAPTLAEIAGASLPPEVEGRSLVPALQGQPLEEMPLFSESLYRVPHESKAMVQDGYKLIYNVYADQFEFYDLSFDPDEQQDLAGEASPVMESMVTDLLNWMAHTAELARELPRAAPPAEFEAADW